MKDAGKFNGHLVYFTSISYILWTFGIFVVIFVYFSSFGMLCQEKSGNPAICTYDTGCGQNESLAISASRNKKNFTFFYGFSFSSVFPRQ
jgi:hypothetical protein